MERCSNCDEYASYLCTHCNLSTWKKPKIESKYSSKEENTITKVNINSDQMKKIIRDITLKIHTTNDCAHKILKNTQDLIAKIQESCMKALQITKSKKQFYLNLLKSTQNALILREKACLERELAVSISSFMPSLCFKSIEKFYEYDFLKEFNSISNLNLASPEDAVKTLETDHGLFLDGHKSYVTILVLTSDNRYIVSGSLDLTLRIWDFRNRKPLAILRGHKGVITDLLITTDNQLIVSASDDYSIKIWSLEGKREESSLFGHTKGVKTLAITRDSKYIISGSADHTVRIWSISGKNQVAVLAGHTKKVTKVVTTSDYKYIASASNDGTIRIWDFNEKVQRNVIDSNQKVINNLSITSNDKYIIFSNDSCIRKFDFEANAVDSFDFHHKYSIWCIKISCDNRYIATYALSNKVIIWDFESRAQIGISFRVEEFDMNRLLITTCNNYIIICFKNSVSVWNLISKTVEAVFQGHSDTIATLAITSDGKYIVTGSYDKTLRICNLDNLKQEGSLPGHTSGVTCLAVTSHCDYIISGSKDKTIRIWNYHSKQQEAVLSGNGGSVCCLGITTDEAYIVSGSVDNSVRIWNMRNRIQEIDLKGHTRAVLSLKVMKNNGFIVSASADLTIRVWRIKNISRIIKVK